VVVVNEKKIKLGENTSPKITVNARIIHRKVRNIEENPGEPHLYLRIFSEEILFPLS